MPESWSDTEKQRQALAEHYGFSTDAISHLDAAVREGGGDMAVFDHPAFLGPGQWMRGGLILITDPADRVLKNRIDALCNALSRLQRESAPAASASHRRIRADARAWDTSGNLRRAWWPDALGAPDAAGDIDGLAYAYFDEPRQLAIRRGDDISWYDTGPHRITGLAGDPDGSNETLVMTSTRAEVPVATLQRLPGEAEDEPAAGATPQAQGASADILDALERLGELQRQGVLTADEFAAKKQALLDRL